MSEVLSYSSQAEKEADKELLEQCREALMVVPKALRLDSCQLWQLKGRDGRITTWGDGEYFLLHIYERSDGRRWGNAKRSLDFAQVTQDAQFGGVLKFKLPVTNEQAANIRYYASLRQQYGEEYLESLRRRIAQHGFKRQETPRDA